MLIAIKILKFRNWSIGHVVASFAVASRLHKCLDISAAAICSLPTHGRALLNNLTFTEWLARKYRQYLSRLMPASSVSRTVFFFIRRCYDGSGGLVADHLLQLSVKCHRMRDHHVPRRVCTH